MTERPLYMLPGGHPGSLPADAHAGLWYDKFCFAIVRNGGDTNTTQGNSGEQKHPKQTWIRSVTARRVGSASLIEELRGRMRLMVEYLDGALVHVEATTSFVTGLGRQHPVDNGFTWHPVLGTPYLPGSSIKGLVLAWARESGQDCSLYERMLGTSGRAGAIDFLDAIPVAPVTLKADIMTPHYDPYYQNGAVPGDWHRPVPVPFLVVATGMRMQIGIVPTNRDRNHKGDIESARAGVSMVKTWIGSALRELGAGAKTAVGYGRFRAYDGSDLDASWVEAVRALRHAALPLIDRVQNEVAALNEQQAMQLVKARMETQEVSDIAHHEALRQALCERFHDQWTTSGMGNTSDWKRKQYLRWLRGEAEPVAPEATTGRKKSRKKKREKSR